MNDKLRRVIAIIALVFAAVFTVAFVAFLVDRALLNGAIGRLAMFAGGITLALYLVLLFDRKSSKAGSSIDEKDDGKKNDASVDEGGSPDGDASPDEKGGGESATDEALAGDESEESATRGKQQGEDDPRD